MYTHYTDTNKYSRIDVLLVETWDKTVTLILAFCRLYTIHQFNSADLTIDCVFFLVSYSRYFSPSSMLRIPKPPSFFVIYPTLPERSSLCTNKNHIVCDIERESDNLCVCLVCVCLIERGRQRGRKKVRVRCEI